MSAYMPNIQKSQTESSSATRRVRREVKMNTYYPIAKIEHYLKEYGKQRVGGHAAHAQAIVIEEVMLIVLQQAYNIAQADNRVTISADDIATALHYHFSDTFLGNINIAGATHREYEYA